MTLNQLVVENIDVPKLETTPPPGLSFPDPAYPLAGALQAIGCHCFSVSSVERYQEAVVRRAKRRAHWVEDRVADFEMNLTAKRSDLLLGWLAALYFCLCAGALISIPAVFVTTTVMPFTIVGWGGAAGLLVGAAAACLHGIDVYRTQRLTPEEVSARRAALAEEADRNPALTWVETALSNYRQAVPDPVRSLAFRVALPSGGTRLVVHHVLPRGGLSRLPRGFAAQFLEARLGDESNFIAAWDENDHRIAWAWTARH